MIRPLDRRTFLAGTAAAAGLTLASGPFKAASAADPLKIGFVYVGPIGDFGWTHGHDLGRKAVETKFGDKVKTTYVENVAEGPDAERVIRKLAADGNKLIFTTSFGYMEPTLKVAKTFPNVFFEHATGFKTAPNVSVYNSRFYEGRAVVGHLAGSLTKTGKIGYIASVPIPEVVMGINATAIWARKVRPDAEVKVVWINSWYDPGKEGDAAKALIDQGVDIITQHTDSPAPLQIAEQRGVLGVGQASDMKAFAPKSQLTAIVDEWGPYYVERTQAVLDGAWKTSDTWHGLKEGFLTLSPYGDAVPEALRASADAIKNGIIDGSIHPFTGPIKNDKGEIKVADGAKLSDGDMLGMNWYVEGVSA
ncbi:BMP family ABC transporter substrate-binding protein [Zavarzinia compransoris]|uniref:BMP family ABC transporter substrate-binding protein n=1 Tax=Zavarzinia compransoris TaxID=1264899 RepID=A0A317EF00_9PROT|nr:BMP family ABC transporter substrate-binding protein [Zavarzinia compransoris]PWR23953.1 BMP family ABC transporter substrate-binding protein [Zavarzinia compransoris]TDP48201.1 nucleoside-binding protein [Zavarzinia compransoris]